MQIRCVEEEITTSVDYQAGKSPMNLTFDNLPTTNQSQTHVKQVIKPGVLNKRKRSSETDKLETAILQSLQPQSESALLGDDVMDTHSRLKKLGLDRQALRLKRNIQILLDSAEDQILGEEESDKNDEFDALKSMSQNPLFDFYSLE
uniref:Uncharacterized protein n=1 Tax=Acrobeloides nanus TaxID=290746 RepID=A0A914DMT8_9BILA